MKKINIDYPYYLYPYGGVKLEMQPWMPSAIAAYTSYERPETS